MKINYTNNQMSLEYVIYMMVGSYFHSANCVSKRLEERLYLHYCEQQHKKQYMMEDRCLRYVNTRLLPNLPTDLWEENVIVKLVPDPTNETIMVKFIGEKYILCMRGAYKGKKSFFSYELRYRN